MAEVAGSGPLREATASQPSTDGHRDVLERMLTEQPHRLTNRMLPAVRDRDLAEDLSQETLTRALQSLATLRGPAEEALVCGWLEAIAANVVRSHARSAGRRPEHVELEVAADLAVDQARSQPEQAVTSTETREALVALIADLPAGLAEVFVARVIDEQPTADVARALDISEDLVRWRLRRARTLLRERIDADVA